MLQKTEQNYIQIYSIKIFVFNILFHKKNENFPLFLVKEKNIYRYNIFFLKRHKGQQQEKQHQSINSRNTYIKRCAKKKTINAVGTI